MRAFPGRRTLAIAQRGFRKDISAALLELSTSLGGILTRYAGFNGFIPRRSESRVIGEIGQQVQRFFVGGIDGRSPFADDGVTALAVYPQLLNKWIVYVTAQVVYEHQNWLRANIPEDVFNWLASRPVTVAPVIEAENPFLQREDESLDEYKARLKSLRIFEPNPYSEYESAHTWVDPNGYRLSDRIWKASVRTREKIDDLVAARIREGKSALSIAKELERFLLPDRAPLRTKKPYGTDASFDGMRLARTEISRAHSEASFIAARNNPYAQGLDWALSPSHPKTDRCDQKATIGKGGQRIKQPYPFTNPVRPPDHPHCLCRTQPAPVEDAAIVTQQLRAVMQNARQDLFNAVTPAQGNEFIELLLGRQLMALVAQVAA